MIFTFIVNAVSFSCLEFNSSQVLRIFCGLFLCCFWYRSMCFYFVWWIVILIILSMVYLWKQNVRDKYIQYKFKHWQVLSCMVLLYNGYSNPSFSFYKIKIWCYRKAFELSLQQTCINTDLSVTQKEKIRPFTKFLFLPPKVGNFHDSDICLRGRHGGRPMTSSWPILVGC